jgi:serine/threonine protein phosphatase PrpC
MANVGDSRCILGTCQETGGSSSRWKALPLSKDQTPRRHDEAKRCRQAGARILSFGQLSGDTRDEDLEDPPRVWAPDGNYPGTAFTRSLGDRVAKRLGVTAEPEVLPISLSKHEKCLVIASDGIWDVLSNQQIMDICQNHHGDPHQACREIVETAHREWLKNDLCASEDDPDASYDDITVVVIMLGQVETTKDDTQGKDEDMPPTAEQPLADVTTEKTKKRVRQKTLRHMEDGPKEDVFFVGSTTSPPEEAASSQTES